MTAAFSTLNDYDVSTELFSLLHVLHSTRGRHTNNTCVLQLVNQVGAWRAVISRGLHTLTNDRFADHVCAGCVHQKIHAKGFVGELFDPQDRSFDFRRRDRCSGKKSNCARVACCGCEFRSRDPTHPRLNNGITDPQQIADFGV